MKKLLGILMAGAMMLSLAACGSTGSTSTAATGDTADASAASASTDLKVGVILVGDETEGYSAAHIND